MTNAAAPASLALPDRLLYAVGSLGNAALFWSQSLWLLYFYGASQDSDLPPRIPVALVGIVLGLGKLLEVFDDPVIGWWSDRTRGRWGRRIPFLLFGTPILIISFWLIWFPPVDGESLLNVLYFFVVIEVFYLARTVVEAPYDALQAELASSSAERVSLGSWKFFFGLAGATAGLVLSPLLIGAFGFGGMGLILALAAGLALYTTLFGLWRRGKLTPRTPVTLEDPAPLFASLWGALRHRAFLALAASFMLFNLGYQVLVAILPFYVQGPLERGRGDVTFYTAGVSAAALVILPLLVLAARRFTKRAIYAASMAALGGYLVFLAIGAFQPLVPGMSLFAQSLALVSLSGLGFAALFVFPGAMVADVIDDDSRRTGQGRAAVFYGMFKTLEKVAQAGAVVVSGVLLQLGQSAENPLGIRLAMPAAGVAVLAGFTVVVLAYRLREARREPVTPAIAAAGAAD